MSRRSAERRQLEAVPCPTCQAAAGDPCISLSSGTLGQQGQNLVHTARKGGRDGRGRPPSEGSVLVRSRPCSFCGAQIGRPCRSLNTNRAYYGSHAARTQL